jgi:transcription elongation GreA/GreB family factor
MTLIDDAPFDTHAIEVGDVVTIRGQDGDVQRYVLVDDGVGTRARSDWVSVGSPLGGAILGRSRGDEVEVESPGGMLSYVILAFERASGDDSVLAVSTGSISPGDLTRMPSEAFLG